MKCQAFQLAWWEHFSNILFRGTMEPDNIHRQDIVWEGIGPHECLGDRNYTKIGEEHVLPWCPHSAWNGQLLQTPGGLTWFSGMGIQMSVIPVTFLTVMHKHTTHTLNCQCFRPGVLSIEKCGSVSFFIHTMKWTEHFPCCWGPKSEQKMYNIGLHGSYSTVGEKGLNKIITETNVKFH